MGRYLGLIVKATRLCNLRCTYCHDWRSGPNQTMSFPVLANLTARALADPMHDTVEFMWHGGEPTVLPRAFYERAVYLQARLRRPGQVIHNTVQTNGTRIDDAWARFFRDFGFRVAVSLDGPPAVHDRYRRYVSGRSSFDDVRRGLKTLRENGIPLSVLMVIDRGAIELGPDAIFDFFVEEGITHYGLIAAKPTNQPSAAAGTHRGPNDPVPSCVFRSLAGSGRPVDYRPRVRRAAQAAVGTRKQRLHLRGRLLRPILFGGT
jgi:uncharacterized protein